MVEPLTIGNTGDGPLNFQLWAGDHVQVSASSGTVAPHSSQQLDVTIDAIGLLHETLVVPINITTNDPVNDTVTVPVTINSTFNGAPIAQLFQDTIDFGTVYQGQFYTNNFYHPQCRIE